MVISRDKNPEQNSDIKIGNKSFRTVKQFKIFGNNPSESNFHSRINHEQIQVKECLLHTVQYLLSSSLLPKNVEINVYRTAVLPVVLYGCKTWSLTLREDRKLWVFENRVLRRIFGPRRDEVTGEWSRIHKEELCALYFSPNIFPVSKSRRLRLAKHLARIGVEVTYLHGFLCVNLRKETTWKTRPWMGG